MCGRVSSVRCSTRRSSVSRTHPSTYSMARTSVGSETSRWTSGFDPKTTGSEATFDAMEVAAGPPVDPGRRGPVPVLDLPGARGAAGSYPIHGRNPRARPDRDASATAIFLGNLGRVALRSGGRRLVFLAVSPTRIRARARRDPLHGRGRGRFPFGLANARVRPSTRVAPPALRASDGPGRSRTDDLDFVRVAS